MKTLKTLAGIGVLLVLVNSHSTAAPLIFTPNGSADLEGSPLDVTYNSTTEVFQVTGLLAAYDGGSTALDYGEAFTLTATINNAGVLAAGGTLNISGDLGSGLETLLVGNLVGGPSGTAWGYNNGGDSQWFSFLFTVGSGGNSTVMNDFGGLGATAGVNLYAQFSSTVGDIPFTGTWGGSFNNNANEPYNGNGYADVTPIPEPGTLAFMVCGLTGLFVLRRRFA